MPLACAYRAPEAGGWGRRSHLTRAGERLLLHREGLGELLDLLAQLLLDLVGEKLLLADRLVDRALGAQVLAQLVLEALHLVGRNLVEEALVAGEDRRHLFLERPGLVLGLVQGRDHPLSPRERLLGGRIQLGA